MSAIATGAATSAAPSTNGASTTNGHANGTQAPAAGSATATEIPKLKGTLKYGNKEEAVELSHDEVLRELQTHRGAALKQRQQAQAEQARREAFLKEQQAYRERQERRKADPLGVLAEEFKESGYDIEQVLEAYQQQRQQLQQLTPEQQRIADLEAQIARREQAEQTKAQQLAAARKAAAKQQRRDAMRQTLLAAMQEAGFPKDNPRLRGKALQTLASIQMKEIRAGRPHMAPKELVAAMKRVNLEELAGVTSELATHPEYRTAHAKELGTLFEAATAGLEGAQLLSFLPKPLVKAVGQALLAARNQGGVVVSELPPSQSSVVAPPAQGAASGTQPTLSVYEAQRRARALFGK